MKGKKNNRCLILNIAYTWNMYQLFWLDSCFDYIFYTSIIIYQPIICQNKIQYFSFAIQVLYSLINVDTCQPIISRITYHVGNKPRPPFCGGNPQNSLLLLDGVWWKYFRLCFLIASTLNQIDSFGHSVVALRFQVRVFSTAAPCLERKRCRPT